MPTVVSEPHLLGGVSQMPPEMRGPGTVEVLENALIDPAHGLRKRPPAEPVGTLAASGDAFLDTFLYAIDRKDDEQYIVAITSGDLKVYDARTGAECSVAFATDKGYLARREDAVSRGFRAFSVGDHTVIVNRDVTVRRGGVRSDPKYNSALIFVRQGDFDTTYSVSIDDETAEVSTPPEDTGGARSAIATDAIAADLYKVLTEQTEKLKDEFKFFLYGSTIHVERVDGGDFIINGQDGLADKGLRVIKGVVEGLDGLPSKAAPGTIIEVKPTADASSKFSTWVRFTDSGDSEGVWEECPRPDVALSFDASTMPHELVREGRFSPVRPAKALDRQPTVTSRPGSTYSTGWTTDGSDVTVNTDTTQNVVVEHSGSIRTPAVSGAHATFERKVQVGFDLDASMAPRGSLIVVTLLANTGSGWTTLDIQQFAPGAAYKDRTFKRKMVVPTGTRFELKLSTKLAWSSLTSSRKVRLVGHGTDESIPGVLVTEEAYTRLNIGQRGSIWPMGTVVSFLLDGTPFSKTLTADRTTAELCSDIAALVDADAGFSAAFNDSTRIAFAEPYTLLGVDMQRAGGGAPVVLDASAVFDADLRFWNPTLTMTPNEHVGRTFKNLTDGSTGTVTANSATAIYCSGGLTGGRTNVINSGDQCAVMGVGEALFVYQQIPWTNRAVGDDDSSPFPSFTDKAISDVFFYAGRLGLLADDAVVMSVVGQPYRFWRQTTTKLLPNDPVDIRSAHRDVGMLDSAVEWKEKLLVCSSAGHQLSLAGEPAITPETVRLDHISSYPQSDFVRPLVVGKSVLFPRKSMGFTQVREMYQTQDGSFASRSLTDHVSKYIPGDCIDIAADADTGCVAILTDGDPTALYVLSQWAEGDHEVHAWNRWTLGGTVLGSHFAGGALYVVVKRGGAVKLERVAISSPYYLATHKDGGTTPYVFRARLNLPYLRDRNGNPVTHGRTQVLSLDVRHINSLFYRVEVALGAGRAVRSYAASTWDGKKRVPILAQRALVTILNDHETSGCGIAGISWEINYTDRSK